MSFLDKIGLGPTRPIGDEIEPATQNPTVHTVQPDKEAGVGVPDDAGSVLKEGQGNTVDPNAQLGVQKIEAVTVSWSKTSLALLLIKYV